MIYKIVINLFSCAQSLSLDLSSCIALKMTQNEKKYPIERAKGSSKKYTAYMKKNHITTETMILISLGICVVSTALGAIIGKRIMK